MNGTILKNSVVFGVGFFILYGLSYFALMEEKFTWNKLLFILVVTVPSTITWGVITHLIKKKQADNRE